MLTRFLITTLFIITCAPVSAMSQYGGCHHPDNDIFSREDLDTADDLFHLSSGGRVGLHEVPLEMSNIDTLKHYITKYPHFLKARADRLRSETLLHRSAEYGHLEIAQELLLAGIPVDSTDIEGRTALQYAATSKQNSALVFLLLKKGADANHQSTNGDTPLHSFARQDTKFSNKPIKNETAQRILNFLVKEGKADINAKNNEGLTPFGLAKQTRTWPVVSLLDPDKTTK
jgi:ankyrin repeat protein